ncbi:MAG: S8 family peptidase [Flavobacteriales bacterium]|jgi:hypothetical protein|nr:S8 family peptidase [Flavobacteriales bacterium]
MNKKKLPIKLFQKRTQIDERRVEGGGDKTPPKWQLSGDQLTQRVEHLLSSIQNIDNAFENRPKERAFIPVTLKIDINDDAIAKSHRADIQKLFYGEKTKNNIIGFIGSNSAIVKVNNLQDCKAIRKNINQYSLNPKGISAVQSIQIFEPFIIDLNQAETIKVSLIDFLNYDINEAVKQLFENFCIKQGIKIKKVNYSSGLIIFKLSDISKVQLDSIKEFEAIESITLMPRYSLSMDSLNSQNEIDIKIPDENKVYPIVGVLDSGVARNKFLKPWLLNKNYSSYPEDFINQFHGSCVSSLIVYGDELENNKWTNASGCMIFDATVFPDTSREDIHEDELVENIRNAIKDNSHIKIWNLSLGTISESDLNEFSDFGKALDEIQLNYDVVICKSVGNCTNFKDGYPKSRVAKSGDSIRSLVVGSITHSKNNQDLAELNHPSPFSRIGPGPANTIKPDLVSFGGNAGTANGRIIPNGVNVITPDGSVSQMVGTSFSTPRVTALLAELDFNINEEFNPTLLKGLAIHSANYPTNLSLNSNERINQMGFGLPKSADQIIYNDPHEITLILQENINKGEFIEILDFPFPDSLKDEDGNYYGEIRITAVTQPILREKQGAEYCQSNLKIQFGTYENIKNRDVTKSTILNPIGPQDPQNVILESNYGAKFKKDYTSEYAKERLLLNYGKKYQPIKKYSVNLDEMKPARKRDSLNGNLKWFLKVKGEYRDFAENLAVQDGEILNQDFTLIITIKDTKREKQVYNEVSRLLASRNFIHSNIKLRENIRIDINDKQ